MNGSSLFRTPSDESRRRQQDLSREVSSEEGLTRRLHLEFSAPVGLLDARTASWLVRVGIDEQSFPSADSCLTAALGRGIHGHGRAFVWRPSADVGTCWLCVPIPREGCDWVALVGFATDDPEAPRKPSQDWGRPCPDRALRAWGQAVSDELRGEAFPRRAPAPPRSESNESVLLSRLIRRMKMSESPTTFQDLATRTVKVALGVEAVAWVPTSNNEPIVLAGQLPGVTDDFYHDLAESSASEPISIRNDAHDQAQPGLHRYAVIAADRKGSSGWMVIINPVDHRPIGAAEVELVQPIASLIGNQRSNWKLYRELKDMLFGIIRSLTEAIDAKDPYTKGHSQRVARIAVKIGEEIGLDSQHRGDIYLMGLLHDIGKIGIKDDVLKKAGKLDDEEYLEVQKHVLIGVEILKGLTKLQHVLPAVRHHHEAYNGSGYPDGLVGDEIPFEARLLAVADSFDAMASNRPYRHGMGSDAIKKIFRKECGVMWDPAIVEALFSCWEQVTAITGTPTLEHGSLVRVVETMN